MPNLKIFIGSSLAGKAQARALVKALRSKTVSFLPWWEAFRPGSILLENMDLLRGKLDGALLVFSPEEAEKIEKTTMEMSSMKVLFEICYLYGHLGKGRVAMVKYGDYYLPKDFGGYTWIAGHKDFRRGRAVVVEENTKTDFLAWTLTLAKKVTKEVPSDFPKPVPSDPLPGVSLPEPLPASATEEAP